MLIKKNSFKTENSINQQSMYFINFSFRTFRPQMFYYNFRIKHKCWFK